jgi:thiol-disulfide isomerase/thioredoxin
MNSINYFSKRVIPAIALSFLVLLNLTGCSSTLATIKIGSELPNARLYYMDGEVSSLGSLVGQETILIFWASTCSHSYGTLESLSDWQKDSKEGRRVKVISVNIDKIEKEGKVKELISKLGLSKVRHSFSGNDIYDEAYVALDVSDLPTLIRVDRYGKIVAAGTSVSSVTDF